jgi:hypothetical protein
MEQSLYVSSLNAGDANTVTQTGSFTLPDGIIPGFLRTRFGLDFSFVGEDRAIRLGYAGRGSWQVALPEYTGQHYDQWLAVGSPACWCARANPRQCRGDADGKSQGKNKFWVSTDDLDVLIAAWNKPFGEVEGEKLNGVPLICADFDHKAQGKRKYRVSTNDLDILIANWQVADGPAPDCP